MTPILLTRTNIDDCQWDSFIDGCQQRVIYAYSWYLDIVCEDWNALVWPSATAFQVVMPIPLTKKWGFTVIRQPFFCQYLGMFTTAGLTPQQGIAFLSYCDLHFSFVSSYQFHPGNYNVLRGLEIQFPSIHFEESFTHWISLDRPIASIRMGYSRDRKRDLIRSEVLDWQEIRSSDLSPVIDLFRWNHASKMENGVTERAYDILNKLFLKLDDEGCAELWYALKGTACHAGALFVKQGETSIYLFNAADKTGRKLNARTHLLDNYFENHAGTFDFETPEVRSISSFYESFGAQKVPFIKIRKNDLPFPLKQIQWLRRWLYNSKTK